MPRYTVQCRSMHMLFMLRFLSRGGGGQRWSALCNTDVGIWLQSRKPIGGVGNNAGGGAGETANLSTKISGLVSLFPSLVCQVYFRRMVYGDH